MTSAQGPHTAKSGPAEVATLLRNRRYVDDFGQSNENVEVVEQIIKQTEEALMKRNMTKNQAK